MAIFSRIGSAAQLVGGRESPPSSDCQQEVLNESSHPVDNRGTSCVGSQNVENSLCRNNVSKTGDPRNGSSAWRLIKPVFIGMDVWGGA